MLKCKKCQGEIAYIEHVDEMLRFKANENGTPEESPINREYTGRVIEMYGECRECGQIYEYDFDQDKILLNSMLDDYPGIIELW